MRLRKGFSNVERAAFGGLKLRIPEQLYTEKMRTQTRFNVSAPFHACESSCIKTSPGQLMRMECDEPSTLPKDRKPMNNASSKVNLVVQRMLFPMLDSPMRTHVLLDTDADQIELDLLDQVGRARPELMDDPQSLVSHLLSLMERYRWSAGKGYGRVATDASRGLT